MCELLGVPVADRAWISVAVTDYAKRGESERVNRELAAYFTALIGARRVGPATTCCRR